MIHKSFEIYNMEALDNAERVISKMKSQCPGPAVLHLFCGIVDTTFILHVADRLSTAYPDDVVIGIASNAEFLDGRITDPVIVLSVMFFEQSNAQTLFIDDLEHHESDAGKKILEFAESIPDAKAIELLACNSGDGFLDLLTSLDNVDRSITIYGGMPFGHDILNDPRYVIHRNKMSESAVIATVFSGENLSVESGYTGGWRPLGQRLKITSCSGCTIHTLNHTNALNVYRHYLGIENAEDFAQNTSEFPLIVSNDNINGMLRHPERALKDGSIVLDGYVREGMTARISFGDPDTIIDYVNSRCRQIARFDPECTLIYSCTARKLFWGPFINNEIAPFEKMASTAGFCTGGEISRDRRTGEVLWHNITLVTTSFREGPKTRTITPPTVKVASSNGQTSFVKRLVRFVKATTKELEDMAIMDGLTKLYNRRKTEELINEHIDSLSQNKGCLTLIMADIDHFKNVNDTYGHDAGDKVLQRFSLRLKEAAKTNGGDAGRWGGEEFFIVLPGVKKEQAQTIAERFRSTIDTDHFPAVGHLTASVGVITIDDTWSGERTKVYTSVDEALYEAKEQGRNRVQIATL